MTWKSYELHLPYFKQGDDLNRAQEWVTKEHAELPESAQHAKALLAHAENLEDAAKMLRRAASIAVEGQLKIEFADTHYIGVICAPDTGAQLVAEEFLSVHPFDEDEDEDGCSGCENCDCIDETSPSDS